MIFNRDSFWRYALKNRWNIGFADNTLEDIVSTQNPLKIHWMKHNYTDRWFADPFVLDVSEEYIYVLAEEYYRPIRGHIVLLKIEKETFRLVENTTLLVLKTHLSFPAIIRKESGIFVYPESNESGALTLYKLDFEKKTLSPVSVIIKESISDAIITDAFGVSCISATEKPNPNGRVMSLFRKEDGVYKRWKNVSFDHDVARNAGDWFTVYGITYRPAQDCTGRYGGALEIQKLENTKEPSFSTIRHIEPSSIKYSLGIHTLNNYKGVTVVDGYGYCRPWIAFPYAWVVNTYHKMRGIPVRI